MSILTRLAPLIILIGWVIGASLVHLPEKIVGAGVTLLLGVFVFQFLAERIR